MECFFVLQYGQGFVALARWRASSCSSTDRGLPHFGTSITLHFLYAVPKFPACPIKQIRKQKRRRKQKEEEENKKKKKKTKRRRQTKQKEEDK
ncbi:hypothetical protein ACQ4LE_010094 [Meloidogyne hapla]|uniref:Secreted protein n=1 Tax=Meloidogyne hapla TaxID=6305 RepID=A0A1I8AX87_MELHA